MWWITTACLQNSGCASGQSRNALMASVTLLSGQTGAAGMKPEGAEIKNFLFLPW